MIGHLKVADEMFSIFIDPCSCVRPAGHKPPCVCAHGEPSDMVPEPTEQEQER